MSKCKYKIRGLVICFDTVHMYTSFNPGMPIALYEVMLGGLMKSGTYQKATVLVTGLVMLMFFQNCEQLHLGEASPFADNSAPAAVGTTNGVYSLATTGERIYTADVDANGFIVNCYINGVRIDIDSPDFIECMAGYTASITDPPTGGGTVGGTNGGADGGTVGGTVGGGSTGGTVGGTTGGADGGTVGGTVGGGSTGGTVGGTDGGTTGGTVGGTVGGVDGGTTGGTTGGTVGGTVGGGSTGGTVGGTTGGSNGEIDPLDPLPPMTCTASIPQYCMRCTHSPGGTVYCGWDRRQQNLEAF